MLVRGTNLSQKSFEYPKDWGQGGRGCWAGGGYYHYPGGVDSFQSGSDWGMSYVTISTLGNSTNFGTLGINGLSRASGTSGRGRGLMIGGTTGNPASTNHNAIRYVTIATLSNASAFGNLSAARVQSDAASNGTRAIMMGGANDYNNPISDIATIEYVTIATPGNSTSFGNITAQPTNYIGNDATGDGMKGLWRIMVSGGGYSNDKYEYVTIDSPGNSTTWGTMGTNSGEGASASSNGSRAFYSGGYNGAWINNIDYLTWSTPSNGVQYGNLRMNYYEARACDDGSRTVIGGWNNSSMEYFSMDLAAGTATISALFGSLTGMDSEGGNCSSATSSACRRLRSTVFAG
jgi:hypothetical protein